MNLRSFEDNAHLIFLLKSFDLEFIEEIIEFHGIDLLEQLINIMDYKFLKADEILFQKKEIANFCYLLLDGKIGCCMNNIDMINSRLKKKKRGKKRENNLNNIMKNLSEISDYSKGEIIAEFQVLSEEAEKYSLTSICKEDCHLICFPKELYKNIVCNLKIYHCFQIKMLKSKK